MTSQMSVMQQHEVRRQAMLQAMHMDVWLPRQQLVNAADSRDYLLEWQTVDTTITAPAQTAVKSAAGATAVSTATVAHTPSARSGSDQARVSVRDQLASLKAAQTPTAAVRATVEVTPVEPAPRVTEPAIQAEPIPRFALQLLRADNCLVLVDLPTGEPFQSRDPDYQLLRDMLRAAGLTDKPSFMRQGMPITWPMLLTGNLMHEQNAAAARACVRDLLSVELQSESAVCIWLVGNQAVRFASAADDAQLYDLQPFVEGAQVWSLPSLESVLEQPLLKRDIWRSMCAVRSLWQVQDDA